MDLIGPAFTDFGFVKIIFFYPMFIRYFLGNGQHTYRIHIAVKKGKKSIMREYKSGHLTFNIKHS